MDDKGMAREILAALDGGRLIGSIVAREPGFGWNEGYAVAAELVRLRRARGERPIGRKIGFTNRNIWAQYGATAPIWAHVYDSTVTRTAGNRASVSLRGSVQPRLEPEIAFGLSAPLAPGIDDPRAVLASVAWYAPSFEIVDCHFADWKFESAESAADFALHWRLVLGEPVPVAGLDLARLAEELRDCRVTLERNGVVMDRGTGANALGHPAIALAHLVAVLAGQPRFEPLAAGEIVTTGTLTAALPVAPGETWRSAYDGLASAGLTLRFTRD